jgi:alpha-D-xyloside xylohydrolase
MPTLSAEPVRLLRKTPTEIRLATAEGEMVLRPLAENAIRVQVGGSVSGGLPDFVFTEQCDPPTFTVIESAESIRVVQSGLETTLNRATGALTFRDGTGREILAEAAGGRWVEASTIQGEPTLAVGQRFVSPPDERLFGTGQFQDGYLNLRGLSRRLTQVNTQIAIPFLLSSKRYGLLWNNYGLTDLNPGDRTVELAPATAEDTGVEVDVTTAEGTKKETRRAGRFAGRFTVGQAGRHAFLLDVGRKMATRYRVEIDGRTVVDMDNLWLPPTMSWITELPAGEHTVTLEAGAEDQPTLTFRKIDDTTTLRSPVADALDYVVFSGEADAVIATYRKLTGAAPLPPLWALGYVHCRERFKSQAELLTTAKEFRQRGLPMDLIVQDWQYWGRHGWNAMRFDERDYPDPAAMVRDLHAMNVRLMVSVWSKVDAASALGKQFAARNLFIPGTTWVDFFNPEAATFYWKNFSTNLLSLGIDAWWQDATEPENDDLAGRRTHFGPGEKTRNLYPLFVTKTVYQGQRADAPDRRVFILTRSAFAGQQRYGAATWSGDIGHDWDTLRRQIPAGLNFVVTGQPYWTTDCGGFFRPSGQYTDPGYHERFLRWFQFSTFSPLQRVHGYQTDTEFWRYGEAVENEARRYLDLRYRLLPYISSVAARVTFDGSTLMRPLVMDFPDDPRALDQEGEYLFGPALLVSPVVQPGVTEWNVYLPETAGGWLDFWTGESLAGGQTVQVDAPLSRIPLHVRAGSILPLGPAEQFVDEKPADPLELRIYGGADAAFTLHEDDGRSYAYESGAFAQIPIRWEETSQTLTIGERQGSFPGLLAERTFRIVRVRPGHGTGPDAVTTPDAELRYTGKERSLHIP